MNLNVYSIFVSIMGERGDGRCNQGDWTAFLRLAGCNLKCKWCDTRNAQALNSGHPSSIDGVIVALRRELSDFNPRKYNILVTGGEPLLQKDALKELFDRMIDCRFIVETNGSIDVRDLLTKSNVSLVVDHKCPSSGVSEKMIVQPMHLRQRDVLKFVVANEDDYLHARSIIRDLPFPPLCTLVMSPVAGNNSPEEGVDYQLSRELKYHLFQWIARDKLFQVGINLQLHKILSVE